VSVFPANESPVPPKVVVVSFPVESNEPREEETLDCWKLPTTCKVEEGCVVPMPTLPVILRVATWRFPVLVAFTNVRFVVEAVVTEIVVPVALVKDVPWNEEAPTTVSVLETVVGTLKVIVEEVTAKRLALLLSRTMKAPVEEVAIRTMKFGSTAVSVRSNKISRELVAVIMFPKSYACCSVEPPPAPPPKAVQLDEALLKTKRLLFEMS